MKIFTSVLGFDFDVKLVDLQGNLVKTGSKLVISKSKDVPNVGTKIGGQTWFTNYNEQLLNKIRDYRRRND